MASLQERPEEYDLVILGGGTGSTIAAWTFAEEGKRVAIIDRKYIGGCALTLHACPARTRRRSGFVQVGFLAVIQS